MLALAILAQAAAFSYDVQSGTGLTLQMAGVPVVRGTWWQYYEPGYTKGYYMSMDSGQKIRKLANGDTSLTFTNDSGKAHGSQLFHKTVDGLTVTYEFHWDGEKPVMVELCTGMVWAPAIEQGSLTIDGKATRSMGRTQYKSNNAFDERKYGTHGSTYSFTSPIGSFQAVVGRPDWVIFDCRGYAQDWATKNDLLWFGNSDIKVEPGKPVVFEVKWTFKPTGQSGKSTKILDAATVKEPHAFEPAPNLPALPQPKESKLSDSHWFVLGVRPDITVPRGLENSAQLVKRFLTGLWSGGKDKAGKVTCRIANLGLPAEGYEVRVTQTKATVLGQDADGVQHGLYTLAALSRGREGKLVVPTGVVRDWPSTKWRGVHMFVGPEALKFHEKLFERALLPAKLNKVVLQCERTDWLATPGIKNELTTSRENLRDEFELLRQMRVEPIPLIQSFGHMEWLFVNGKNLDIAMNPAVAYTVDPRGARTRQLLTAIWDEAVALLKPKTIHFGLDEVDMLGMSQEPEFVTSLWETHLPFLAGIAEKHKMKPMLWGDKGLAPGEAIDAALGDSADQAKRRRGVMPKGALIGDWHYSPEAEPGKYLSSLKLWKGEGFEPVASTWYVPDNNRGFSLAAIQEGAGVLVTTWAGYSSTEKSMQSAYYQYAAYLLAADYAWSGRKEMPSKLGYDASAVLRRMMVEPPSPVTSQPGRMLSWGKNETHTLGRIRFAIHEPLSMLSAIDRKTAGAPDKLTVKCAASGRSIALAMDCLQRCAEGESLGRITLTFDDEKTITKPLVYGREVRSFNDDGYSFLVPRYERKSVLTIPVGAKNRKLKSIEIRATNRYAGLRLYGVTVF